MTMTVRYEFLTNSQTVVSGEIRDVPEFSVASRSGHDRICKLIEARAGDKIYEMRKLETYNEAAELVRANMRK